MKKREFRPKRRIEREYSRAIIRIMESLRNEISKQRNPSDILSTIRRFTRSPTFKTAVDRAVRQMMTHLFQDGQKTWREASMRASKGKMIRRALQEELGKNREFHAIIEGNSKLISSLAEKSAMKASKLAAEGYARGIRPEVIMKELLHKWPSLSYKRAKVIARTETSKASTALTRARASAAGLSWYVWRTSDDERVRSSHQKMEGVLIPWHSPPNPEKLAGKAERTGPYHAGDIYNCRCYPEPLIDYEDVTWPHKVFYRGSIEYMTLAKFKQMTGGML